MSYFSRAPVSRQSVPQNRRFGLLFLLLCAEIPFFAASVQGASSQVTLKDGRVLNGSMATVESVALDPNAKRNKDEIPSERIVVIDDSLRQTYIGKGRVFDVQPDEIGASLEVFKLHQPAPRSGETVSSVGIFRSTAVPFDEFGRRIVEINGNPIVQGITEISPRAIHIKGITLSMDTRISPLNFNRKTLTALIKRGINPGSLDDRLRIYQFYVQADLFDEAAEEMAEIVQDFRDDPENGERLAIGLRMIRELAADRLITELEARRSAGQHRKVRGLLQAFEEQSIAPEKIQTIRRMMQDTAEEDQKIADLNAELAQLAAAVEDEKIQEGIRPILDEIAKELNPNTLERFSEYFLSKNDASLTDESRLAIALSSWLTGNIGADTRLELALSTYRLRQLIRKYLLDPTAEGRATLWEQIRAEEAAAPERTARVLYLMKPPLPTRAGNKETPLEYDLTAPSYETGKEYRYLVQLPPEYDPNRKYPLVITLHGERTTPEQQLDWWAGMRKEDGTNERSGQAGRFGFIVLAPEWSAGENDLLWDYSPAQSGAVLYTLRDAMRRFSINSDQIFLSGHSAGADGVWDLGLAHPDLWAGIIPICGEGVKYPLYLRKNAEYVPIYGIGGELDGGKLARCKTILDEGMNRANPYDMTFVLFKGRGNEPFSDEIIRLFEWMRLRTRNNAPNTERTVYSMRPWDNAFWNLEQLQFPDRTMIMPFNWVGPLSHNYYAAETEFFLTQANTIRIKSKGETAQIGLSPETVNFDQPMEVYYNGKKITPANGQVLPNIRTQLEDVRTRGDRQHPFWAMLDVSSPGKPLFSE